MAEVALCEALIHRLRGLARQRNHRLILWLSGEAEWTAHWARWILAVLPDLKAACLAERPILPSTLPLRAAIRLLGQDLDLLLYDAHGGFDPDGFGAASGAIRGGGLLVLLTPPTRQWLDLLDPQAERLAVWPHEAGRLNRGFMARLIRVLDADASVIRVQPGARAPGVLLPRSLADAAPALEVSHPPLNPARASTPDQARAVAAILKTAHGRARRPLVLTAHRGRGKSAALGLAAGQLLLEGGRRLLMTAPRQASTETIQRHAEAVLEAAGQPARPLIETLAFWSPDALVETWPETDLLLVDEAAGIPTPRLEALLRHYARLVFATTVHGYEGTGRGFEIRFRDRLERLTPNWRALTLETPIRWAAEDPLERLTFRALLLDAAPAPDAAIAEASPRGCVLERLSRDALLQDEARLRELFGLLVLAHYQTRPMDLRMLLDGPNVRIHVLRHAGHLVAALLCAEEGGFEDAGLRAAIYRGERRPRGHLLPQTLSAHAGLREAPAYRYLRVIRIAVHPAAARRGLGRLLLGAPLEEARAEGLDLVGASFGVTPELLAFWTHCGFRPAQIGLSRNAASGEQAVVMLKPVSDSGARFVERASRRLEARLPVLLAGPLRGLDPAIALALTQALPPPPVADGRDEKEAADRRSELDAFISGHRTLEVTLPLLSKLTRHRLPSAVRNGDIGLEDAELLLAAARQLRPMPELVRLFGGLGRDEMLARLRRAAARLLSTAADH